MSLVKIRSMLEQAIVNVTPVGVETAFENALYVPKADVPFQSIFLVMGKPRNERIGDSSYREVGFVQVTLQYQLGQGSASIASHVDLLRAAFKRGTVLHDTLDVVINQTPEVKFITETDRYLAVIRIYFYCDIFST